MLLITICMNSQITFFAVLAFAAIFAMVAPIDYAMAESAPTHDGESLDGEDKGKSCPSKERKSTSISIDSDF